jgi:tetratricopeptide (TPR) repeat protein
VALLAIVGRWAFQLLADARERAIASEYAAAQDTAAFQAFAAAHPRAPLAAAAHLRLADEAYAAGKFQAAVADYDAAAKILAGQPLGDRARIGSAIARLQAGDAAAATTALEALANDTAFTRTFRGEAAFHLAVLSRDAGRPAEAVKWTELVLAADPTGLWAQRALQLRSSLPAASTTSEPAPVASELKVTPATPSAEPVTVTSEPAPSVSFPSAK